MDGIAASLPRKSGRSSRLFLEIMLVLVFVFILTYSPGHNNSRAKDPLKMISGKQDVAGESLDLAHATVKVTESGFVVDGKLLTRDDLVRYLDGEGRKVPLVSIQPGVSMSENLRWLLDVAGKDHEIELAL